MQTERDWFRVEISDHKGQVVAIETEMLAGRDIGDEERDVINRAIDHLAGFVGRPAVREGWVSVPVEPTKHMLAMGTRHDWMDPNSDIGADVEGIYAAMLAARPGDPNAN
jgi:hypothetical protein